MTNGEAYRILTSQWTNMHHSERTGLDNSSEYQDILDLVKEGKRIEAVFMATALKTDRGDAWRVKMGDLPFAN